MARRASLQEARVAKATAAAMLKEIPSVNGVGIIRSRGGYALKVNLVEPSEDVEVLIRRRLSDALRHVPVRVEVVGPITKRP